VCFRKRIFVASADWAYEWQVLRHSLDAYPAVSLDHSRSRRIAQRLRPLDLAVEPGLFIVGGIMGLARRR
jgi:hypothetical protein